MALFNIYLNNELIVDGYEGSPEDAENKMLWEHKKAYPDNHIANAYSCAETTEVRNFCGTIIYQRGSNSIGLTETCYFEEL